MTGLHRAGAAAEPDDTAEIADYQDTDGDLWRSAEQQVQVDQARINLVKLTGLTDDADLTRRAAIILAAPPYAPPLERLYGGRASHEGTGVRCRTCRAKWQASGAYPYINAATAADGQCPDCFMRPVVYALIGLPVPPAPRRPAAPRPKPKEAGQ